MIGFADKFDGFSLSSVWEKAMQWKFLENKLPPAMPEPKQLAGTRQNNGSPFHQVINDLTTGLKKYR